jgi:hypothetical protein
MRVRKSSNALSWGRNSRVVLAMRACGAIPFTLRVDAQLAKLPTPAVSSCLGLGILGRQLLNVCVKFWEDEVASGVRSTSADTLSDQPLSEWPAGREADRTLAQRTAAVGLTDRRSLSEFALMADRPLRLCRSRWFGPRRSEAEPQRYCSRTCGMNVVLGNGGGLGLGLESAVRGNVSVAADRDPHRLSPPLALRSFIRRSGQPRLPGTDGRFSNAGNAGADVRGACRQCPGCHSIYG